MRTKNTGFPFPNIHLIQSFLLKDISLRKEKEQVKNSMWIGQNHGAGTGTLKLGTQCPSSLFRWGTWSRRPAAHQDPLCLPPVPPESLPWAAFTFYCPSQKFFVMMRWLSKLLSCPTRGLWGSYSVLMSPHGCSWLWGQIDLSSNEWQNSTPWVIKGCGNSLWSPLREGLSDDWQTSRKNTVISFDDVSFQKVRDVFSPNPQLSSNNALWTDIH